MISIYTDASLLLDPTLHHGGIAYTISGNGYDIAYSEHIDCGDINELELICVIRALGRILPTKHIVNIYTDSAYISCNVEFDWFSVWQENNWINPLTGKVIKNKGLWEHLSFLIERSNVNILKVEAHSGDLYNDIVDKLAKKAAATSFSKEEKAARRASHNKKKSNKRKAHKAKLKSKIKPGGN